MAGKVQEVCLNLHKVHFRVRRPDKDKTSNLRNGIGKEILKRAIFQVYRPILPEGLLPDYAPSGAMRKEDAAKVTGEKGFIEGIWRIRERKSKPELEGYWADMGNAVFSAAPEENKLKWDRIMISVDRMACVITSADGAAKRSLFEVIGYCGPYGYGEHDVFMALDRPTRKALLRSLSGHEINMLYKEMLNQREREKMLRAFFEALDEEGYRKLFYEHYQADYGNDCSGIPTLEQTLLARVGRKNRLAFFRAAQGNDVLLAALLVRQVDEELFQDKIMPILSVR